MVGLFMSHLYGSDDLFPGDLGNACHPYQSVNYITSHDGFTLYDLFSYNQKQTAAIGQYQIPTAQMTTTVGTAAGKATRTYPQRF